MKDIFGDSKRMVLKEDFPQMKYCEAVIYETLRVYPPIPFIMRYADRDLELSEFSFHFFSMKEREREPVYCAHT